MIKHTALFLACLLLALSLFGFASLSAYGKGLPALERHFDKMEAAPGLMEQLSLFAARHWLKLMALGYLLLILGLHLVFPKAHMFSHGLLLLWSVVVLLPVYLLVANAMKLKAGMYGSPFGLPAPLTMDNFASVVKDGNFFSYFGNSLFVVAVSLSAILLFGALAGYALAHWRSRFPRALYFFFVLGMMLPIKISTIRLMELMKHLGLFNSLWSIILIYIAMGMPISVFVLTEFVYGLPKDLYEAAHIDGARHGRVFYQIVLPLIKPALATVGIYNLVPIWNDLWFPLIFITQESKKTVLLAVTRLQGQYTTDWPKVFALLTLSALPVLALYLSMSRQFVAGLTAGAVKG